MFRGLLILFLSALYWHFPSYAKMENAYMNVSHDNRDYSDVLNAYEQAFNIYHESSLKQIEMSYQCLIDQSSFDSCDESNNYFHVVLPMSMRRLRTDLALSSLVLPSMNYQRDYIPLDFTFESIWAKRIISKSFLPLDSDEAASVLKQWKRDEARLRRTYLRKLGEEVIALANSHHSSERLRQIESSVDILKSGDWWIILNSKNSFIVTFVKEIKDNYFKLNKRRVIAEITLNPFLSRVADLSSNQKLEQQFILNQISESKNEIAIQAKEIEKEIERLKSNADIEPLDFRMLFDIPIIVDLSVQVNPTINEKIEQVKSVLLNLEYFKFGVYLSTGLALLWTPAIMVASGVAAIQGVVIFEQYERYLHTVKNAYINVHPDLNSYTPGDVFLESTDLDTNIYLLPMMAFGMPFLRFSNISSALNIAKFNR